MPLKNEEAEHAVIGELIRSGGEGAKHCLGKLDADAFCSNGLGKIYSAAIGAWTSRGRIDLVLLDDEFVKAGYDNAHELMQTTQACVESAISISNMPFHVELVRKCWHKRRLRKELTRLNDALEYEESISPLVGSVKSIMEVAAGTSEVNEDVDQLIMEAMEDLEPDIKTGHSTIDELIGGWHRGEVHVLGARPANGKTTWAMELAAKAAEQGHKVAVASLEMPRGRMMQKLLARETAMNTKEIAKANDAAKTEIFGMMKKKMETDWTGGMRIWDSPTNPFMVPELIAQGDVDIVFVDYIQFGLYGAQVRLDVTRACNMMKVIAKERNIAIVVCAQLNRDFKGREDPRPQLSDLAESGGIEQFGCNILLLHYPDKTVPGVYDPDLYEVIAAKSRYGSTGIVSFDFDGGTVQIRERGKVAEEASAQEELFVNGSK